MRAIGRGELGSAEGLLKANLLAGPRAAQSRYGLGIVELLMGRTEIARDLIDSAFALKAWLKDLDPSLVDLGPSAAQALQTFPDWTWPRYELERHAFFSVGLRLDHVVRRHLGGPDFCFVEVGANDGRSHDPIYPFVTRYGWRGLCIEPVPDTHAKLVETYAAYPQVRTSQTAIAAKDGTVELHLAERSTLASLTPERNSLSKEGATSVVTVRAQRLESALEDHEFEQLDLLQIDTEGYDYEVLRTIDLRRWRPMIINMEFYCLPIAERLEAFRLLRDVGYAYRFDGMDLIAVDHSRIAPEFSVWDMTAGRWLR